MCRSAAVPSDTVGLMDKSAWRERLLHRAPVIPSESTAVAHHVADWLDDHTGRSVLVYLPMAGEIDLTPIVGDAHRWLVTRTPSGGRPLTVHEFTTPRERHRFGYDQPVEGAPEVDPVEIDIVLTPGLGFDVTGGRLGWGMGYYDRLFEATGEVTAVGVTLERLLLTERLPAEDHDRRMDLLATDAGVRPVRPG